MEDQQVLPDFSPAFLSDTGNLHALLETAAIGIWELQLETNNILWDEECRKLFGIAVGNSISYADLLEHIHLDDVDRVRQSIAHAIGGGDLGKFSEIYRTIDPVTGELRWLNFIGKAYFDGNGNAFLFGGIARNITEIKINDSLRRAQKETEADLRSIIHQAPLGIGVLKGRNMILESGNDSIFEVWGRKRNAIGIPLTDFPKIKGQDFIELLKNVYDHGEPFYGYGLIVKVERKGKFENLFFDFICTPLRDYHDVVSGVIVLAMDVTSKVMARNKIEETEISLLGAIELAKLGTWTLDLATGIYDYSKRLRSWFGFGDTEIITIEKTYAAIDKQYWPLLKESIEDAIEPGGNNKYDLEYRIKAQGTSQVRIIRSIGKVFFDETGKAFKISGTAQDITLQRELQISLEHEVLERTIALATSNEELAIKVEEVAKSNADLIQSNEELEQYAYIASHDLQEPLRKIRIFSDKLLGKVSAEEAQSLLKKINHSAERMTLLIHNVLEFSKLSELNQERSSTDLNSIVKDVINDFELLIEEKGAMLQIDELPIIEAIPTQMHQLFQNLLGNALKFSTAGVSPKVRIQCRQLDKKNELAEYVLNPLPFAQYFMISFSDNGIGFDSKYGDRIFKMFQRLNNQEEFEGAGIGLALCKRIVSYHLGNLMVTSAPGKGTTFGIVLPDKQQE